MAYEERFRESLGKKSRLSQNHWLRTHPIAHRGLHDGSVPENSLLSFQLAAAHGYAVELDVALSKDGEVVVFHDANLARVTGKNAYIWELTLSELRTLRLYDTDQHVATLAEVLSLIRGRVPLLIEIKAHADQSVVKKTLNVLKNYRGQYAVQSFDPRIIMRVKKLYPNVLRGILGSRDDEEPSAFRRFFLRHMPLNFLAKPDFISHSYDGIANVSERKIKGKALLCWTVRTSDQLSFARRHADNVIFENIRPQRV